MKKRNCLIAVALIAVLMLSGCKSASYDSAFVTSKSDYGNSSPRPATESYASNADMMYDSGYAYGAESEGDYNYSGTEQTSANAAPAQTGRKLIKRVSLSIETLEFDRSVSAIEQAVAAYGGYVENSTVIKSSGYNYYGRNNRNATYVLRIPAETLDGFMGNVGNIGNITSQNTSSEDITLSYIDLEARTESLEIQQERLLALLEKAETVDEIISLEDRLSTVRYQIEAQRSQLKNYDNLVSFSTVTINLYEVVRVTEPEPETVGERISQGLSDTFYDLGEWFKDFAVGFVVNLPYILIWAVIIFVIVFIIVKIVKRSKKNKAKKAAAAQAAWAARQTNTGYAPVNPAPAKTAPVQQTVNNTENKQ